MKHLPYLRISCLRSIIPLTLVQLLGSWENNNTLTMAVGHVLTCSAIFVVCCLYYDIGAWKWQNVTQSYFAVYHSDWGQQNGSFGGLFDADVSCVARRIFRLQGKNNVNGTADSYGMESMDEFYKHSDKYLEGLIYCTYRQESSYRITKSLISTANSATDSHL